MLEVGTGSGLSARYMSEAKHVSLCTFDEGKEHEEVISLLKDVPEVDYRCKRPLSVEKSCRGTALSGYRAYCFYSLL